MVKTLQQVGNSQAIVLDKPLLESLGISKETKLHVRISGRSIILTPADGSIPTEEFERVAKKVARQNAELLKRLS